MMKKTKLNCAATVEETFAERLLSLPKIQDMLNTALAEIIELRFPVAVAHRPHVLSALSGLTKEFF